MGAPKMAQALYRFLNLRNTGGGTFFPKCFLQVIFENYKKIPSPEKTRQHKLILPIKRYTHTHTDTRACTGKGYTETHLFKT